MPAQRPPTLVFDLDGTLLDVSARHHHVYSTVVTALGAEPLARADYWQMKRQAIGWPEILAASGLPEADVADFEAKFAELIELPDSLGFDVLFTDATPVPVSYTHLDVYKRQNHHRGGAPLGHQGSGGPVRGVPAAPRLPPRADRGLPLEALRLEGLERVSDRIIGPETPREQINRAAED